MVGSPANVGAEQLGGVGHEEGAGGAFATEGDSFAAGARRPNSVERIE